MPLNLPKPEEPSPPLRGSIDEAVDDLIRHLAEAAGVTVTEAYTAMRDGQVIVPRRRAAARHPALAWGAGGLFLVLAGACARCVASVR